MNDFHDIRRLPLKSATSTKMNTSKQTKWILVKGTASTKRIRFH